MIVFNRYLIDLVLIIYFVKNSKLDSNELFSTNTSGAYHYSNGWQIKGVYSIFLGFIFSASTIWNINLNFLQSYAWIIGAIVAFIIYYLLSSD